MIWSKYSQQWSKPGSGCSLTLQTCLLGNFIIDQYSDSCIYYSINNLNQDKLVQIGANQFKLMQAVANNYKLVHVGADQSNFLEIGVN